MNLTHIRLLVADFRSCFRFYRDVLGFKATFGKEDEVYADFDAGSVTLALFDRKIMAEAVQTACLPSAAKSQDRAALILGVEDFDSSYQQLKKKGVSFITEPTSRTEWGIRVAHFRDPDGNLLEIYSALKT
ncbi:VOC family protein [Candidatus Acetothermia bacterium]|nr:VOC family protein [Candidatus Acetothermia bacterium]MBI3643720.1 VOC family protein [Candidatus Acetothermia bacterium]